ncbi:sialidase family protein [Marinicella sp. W31]|uniref:sialidase family protein n=1 Tax=Marinicella sp. W31 TaxID=3023713 RepID=UPI00375724BE
MRTFFVIGSLLMLFYFLQTPPLKNNNLGPLALKCPQSHFGLAFRKSGKPLDTFSNCYNTDIQTLDAQGLLLSKVHWLKLKSGAASADVFLQEAINALGHRAELNLARAKLLISMQNWQAAQKQLDLAKIAPNHYLRLLVEPRTGMFSPQTDFSKLPAIYQYQLSNQVAPRAQITTRGLSQFDMQRVDDANVGVLGGETSMKVSADGQNLWLTWTDSSADFNGENRWRLRSARSTDGGQSWLNEPFSPNPEVVDLFHFDPMTAYDSINDIMFAGGMTLSFNDSTQNSFYFYEWNLNNNNIAGPFRHFFQSLDKGWAAVDDNGRLWFAENQNFPRFSDDGGQNFSLVPLQNGYTEYAPQPIVDNNNCVHIMDILGYLRCDGQGGFDVIRDTSLTSISFFDMGTYLPGTFRAVPLTLMAVHPNGDLYTIYPDFDTPDSGDVALWMTRSIDNGDTWQNPWIVSPDVPGDRFLPWLEIDKNGGFHLMYADTRHVTQSDTSTEAWLDIYYSFSANEGQSWQESRITPTTLEVPTLFWGDYMLSDYIEMAVSDNAVFLSFPWSDIPGEMDIYVAKKSLLDDLIFSDGFE